MEFDPAFADECRDAFERYGVLCSGDVHQRDDDHPWCCGSFHPLKFEAQMAFRALVYIPARVSLQRPRFATVKADQQMRVAVEA